MANERYTVIPFTRGDPWYVMDYTHALWKGSELIGIFKKKEWADYFKGILDAVDEVSDEVNKAAALQRK